MPGADLRYLITGAAGFIGSALAQSLLRDGHEVLGIDSFTEYYDVDQKRRNLEPALDYGSFRLVEEDLTAAPLPQLLEGVDTVFHQAGEPGVRGSWRAGFSRYVERNIRATQTLLEALRDAVTPRLVYASSSSVYGNSEVWPCIESQTPEPYSPYGVTKLAAEHLVRAYSHNFDIPAIALRYFTVYGPHQRPDMLMHRLCEAVLGRQEVTIFGGGEQVRDFTYVDDVVSANRLAAANMPRAGCAILNICGGTSATLADVINIIEHTAGRRILRHAGPAQSGDVMRTGGSSAAALALIGWKPQINLHDGLRRQLHWHMSRH